jgi:P27 family predicted phage terminase small subunit
MPNKYQKPVSELQYKRGDRAERRTLQLVQPDQRRPAPDMPKDLEPGAQRAWRKFWRSQSAGGIDLDSDLAAILRWIHCLSEVERLQPLADKTPLVKGSTGQLTANPLYGVIASLKREVERYEEHFGMTSLSRMRLGIATVQHAASVHDLTARLERRRAEPDAIEAEVLDLGAL